MQYLHGKDEWQQTNVVVNSLEDISTVNNNNNHSTTTTTAKMNGGTFEKADGVEQDHRRRCGGSATPPTDAESSGTFSMEASLSRIDALAESLSDLTRKRVVGHQQQQGRVKKRPSIGSTCSGANTSMCSGSSLAIDELASIDSAFLSSIDGFSAVSSVDNLGIGRLSLGGGGDDGASTTSARFSSGMWSVQDCEPWTCSICTFDNEPVFLSCEMCGQTRTASARVQTLNNHRRISSHHQQVSEEQERERTRLQQEQRMREFQQQEAPPSGGLLRELPADAAAAASSSPMASLPIPTVVEAKRRKKTKAERDARRKREARERAEERRRNSGQIPSMETTLEETGESPSSSGSARSSRSGRRKSSSSSSKSSRHKTAPPPGTTTTTHIGGTSGAATVVTNVTTTSASTISTMSTMSTLGTNTPSAAPIASNTAPVRPSSPMQDGSLQNVFEFSGVVNKPYRKRDPMDESTATERTFDMDQSAMTNMGMSQSMMGMSQSNMDASSNLVLGQSSRQWYNSGSRRSGGSSNKYNKAYRQQQSWFEGMDEISDEISV